MKINWKVRIRHRQFWVAIISAFVLLINHTASLFGVDITLISAKVQQLLESILLILALFGIIIDPTTAGVHDSSQVMVYSKPRKETEHIQRSVGRVDETHQETKIEVHHETKIEVVQQQESAKDKVEENSKK
ncbi:phage holin [Ureibacillus sinduriensis]|uniref:phage holin n=1 Tax=Ureibacillus sinduriensis TaxID=561440 RepID=UPI000A02924A|nr:phage holin [Ureibacillus sinduriensis]